MQSIINSIGFMTIFAVIIHSVVTLRNKYLQNKVKKLERKNFLDLIKKSPNAMTLHFQKVSMITNASLKNSENIDYKAQILDDYNYYVGIYDKIKTNQDLSDNELISFSKFYLYFTKNINESERIYELRKQKINNLYKVNLN